MKRRTQAFLIATAMLLATPIARADDPIAAEATFAKGRALMKAGSYAEACSAFELSLSLERAVGTQVNLAECYVKIGKTASAWLTYREAAAAAQAAGQSARAAEARDRAAKVEPSLCKLVIKVPDGAPAATVIKRDGKVVDRLLWGVAVPVDPGPHDVVETFGGEQALSRRVTIEAPKQGEPCVDAIVEMPVKHEAAAPVAVVAPPVVAPPPVLAPRVETATPVPDDASSRRTTRRAIGVGIGGLGLIAVGVGSAFGVAAIAKKNGAACTDAGCTIDGRTQMRAAGSSADVATGALTSGLVLLAAGTIVWLTAPSSTGGATDPLRGPSKPPTAALAF